MTIGHFSDGQFSPDGRWFAVTGRSGAVALFPTQAGTETVTLQLPARGGAVDRLQRHGRLLGVGSRRRVAYVWKMATFPPASHPALARHAGGAGDAGLFRRRSRPWSLQASRAGRRGAGALDDPTKARCLPPASGTHRVAEVAVSPDGRWLAAGSVAAMLWRTNSRRPRHAGLGGRELLRRPRRAWWSRLRASPSVVMAGGWPALATIPMSNSGTWRKRCGVWRRASRLPPAVQVLRMAGTRAHFDRSSPFILAAPCMVRVATAFFLNGSLPPRPRRLRPASRHSFHSIPAPRCQNLPRWTVDGRGPSWVGQTFALQPASGNQVLLYDVAQPGPPVLPTALTAHFLSETRLSFSPDSRWLAAGSGGYPPDLWDLRSVDRAGSRRSAPVPRQTFATAFSPDGRWLALGGDDGAIHLWDWREGTDRVPFRPARASKVSRGSPPTVSSAREMMTISPFGILVPAASRPWPGALLAANSAPRSGGVFK